MIIAGGKRTMRLEKDERTRNGKKEEKEGMEEVETGREGVM